MDEHLDQRWDMILWKNVSFGCVSIEIGCAL